MSKAADVLAEENKNDDIDMTKYINDPMLKGFC